MDLVGRQLNEHMERLNRTFEGAGYTAEQTERMIRQAQEATNRAAARTEDKLRRAQEKLERKLETARRRAERRSRGRRSSTDWAAPFPAEPESEPVSDNERLAILQMLEQKKITVEQAEELLSALEGEE
jgi:predicted Holliday junction resolvase-like endonuclease